MAPPPRILDAIVVGAGPSGLGASLALSGYRPHLSRTTPLSPLSPLSSLLSTSPASLLSPLDLSLVRSVASRLRGRSHNPLALFFDALLHPGVDEGNPTSTCLDIRRSDDEPLTHLVLDTNPPGGAWHSMHEFTRTLSPGPWMELPGFPLTKFLEGLGTVSSSAATVASMRQPRRLVAEYYKAAAAKLGVAEHHRPWRVTRIEAPSSGNDAWTVFADGSETPLLARHLVLATGTYAVPTRLNVDGESLPRVVHRCAQLPESAQTVLVVGAGLSAADCMVHLLGQGRTVLHVHRGPADATKLQKFASPHSAGMYPEYHALISAMATAPTGAPTDLLGGRYSVYGHSELRAIGPDGDCSVEQRLGDERTPTSHVFSADAVAILVGSSPDFSFLPASVHEALAAAGPPSQLSEWGVKATHRVFVDVEPFTMEVKAVPTLFALGPLRGDNFARFAIHDGFGVAETIRERRGDTRTRPGAVAGGAEGASCAEEETVKAARLQA
jgi:hypothetical protein